MTSHRQKRVLLALAWQNETIARSMARYARQVGWHLDLQMYTTGKVPKEWSGEGIVTLLGGRRDLSHFVRKATVPVVCLTLNEPGVPIPRVDFDNAVLGRLAAQHFLNKRFKAFAWYSCGEQVVERLRAEGYLCRLKEAGYDCQQLVWCRARGRRGDSWANRQAWLSRVLSRQPEPLAILCSDDTVAVEVIEACIRTGIRIPEQVAVMGIGNLELYSDSTPIALSSISVDYELLALEAARLLDRQMAGKRAPTAPILIAPSGIVARKSTDTIAVDHPEVASAIRFMLDHYNKALGVRDIVAATTIAQTRLYQAFQTELEQSPMAVLRTIRMEKAKQMLRETDMKVRDVAKACGLVDAINLYRLLIRDCGMAPKKYRANSC